MDKAGAREDLFGTEPSMTEATPAPKPVPPLRRPTMTRIVDDELLEVDIETGHVRMPATPYVSPWGTPPRTQKKKGRKRR